MYYNINPLSQLYLASNKFSPVYPLLSNQPPDDSSHGQCLFNNVRCQKHASVLFQSLKFIQVQEDKQ